MSCCKLALWLCTLALLSCASAAPLPVIALTPEGPFTWERGRALLHDVQREAHFWAAFERDHGDYLEWRVRIENRSQRTLRLSPEYFFYRVAETERGGRNVRALDPTRWIAELDAQRARADAREADAQRHAGHDFVDHFIDHLLGFEHPTPSERRHARDQQRATYLAERQERERWRELLADRAVRRGELRPGESAEGSVLFPRLDYPGRTELVLIVPPAIARFAYAGRR